MAGTTPALGFRYPTGPDAPNVPLDIKNLAQDVETQIVGPFTGNLHLQSGADLRWNSGDTILSRAAAGIITTASRVLGAAPYFHGYATGALTLTNTVAALIPLAGELIDNSNGHSNAVNPSRYVPTIAGYYECDGMVLFVGNTAGDRTCHFRLNGVQPGTGASLGGMPAMNGAGFLPGCCYAAPTTILCNGTTDYIELWATQNTGGNLDTFAAGSNGSQVRIRWVAHP